MKQLIFLSFILFLSLFAQESSSKTNRKTVWFLAGHMQDIFSEEYLEPMKKWGYDFRPLHKLYARAAEAGFDFILADPKEPKLTPFSHINSGIPEVEEKRKQAHGDQGVLDVCSSPDKIHRIIVFEIQQLQYLRLYPQKKLILFLWEPPSVMPENYNLFGHKYFSRIYTWNDDLVDGKKYYKFFYPILHPMISDVVDFNSKKFCVLIAGNRASDHPDELYSERRRVVDFFENFHHTEFDLYGRWWPKSYKTYKGELDNKIEKLKEYKFCIAYENIKNIRGYITEKIFDCFEAGCIPVYLGASNVSYYIPKNCFIDRNDFESESALYTFLNNMTKNQYEEYIKNIRHFLVSEQAQLFSADNFVKIVMESLDEKGD